MHHGPGLAEQSQLAEPLSERELEVLGMVENMSHFVCPHCKHEIDIFSKGGGDEKVTNVWFRFNPAFVGDLFPAKTVRELIALAIFSLVLGTLATRAFHKRLG